MQLQKQQRQRRLNKLHQVILGYKGLVNLAGLLVVKLLHHMAIVHIQFGALQFTIQASILVLMKVHLFMLLMEVLLFGLAGWVVMVMP